VKTASASRKMSGLLTCPINAMMRHWKLALPRLKNLSSMPAGSLLALFPFTAIQNETQFKLPEHCPIAANLLCPSMGTRMLETHLDVETERLQQAREDQRQT